MEPKNIVINCPEGYEYYLEGNEIKFRKEEPPITWDRIKNHFIKLNISSAYSGCTSILGCPTIYPAHTQSIYYAYCKLLAIAKYLNGDWFPCNGHEKWYISYLGSTYVSYGTIVAGTIYFKDEESANKAIKLIGDDLKDLF